MPPGDDETLGIPQNAQEVEHSNGSDRLRLRNMGSWKRYKIYWWNPLNGSTHATKIKWSGLFGRLRLRHDKLNDDFTESILYFKTKPHSVFGMMQSEPPTEEYSNDHIIEEIYSLLPNESNESPLADVPTIDDSYYEVSVYPNPSSGVFTVELLGDMRNKSASVTLSNVLGVKVETALNVNTSYGFNLSNYSNGIYYIKVYTNEISIFKKVVKE